MMADRFANSRFNLLAAAAVAVDPFERRWDRGRRYKDRWAAPQPQGGRRVSRI
jgi:hypothetical protein